MDNPKPGGCLQCTELQKKIAELTAHQEKLEAELARAKKNSSTSSKGYFLRAAGSGSSSTTW